MTAAQRASMVMLAMTIVFTLGVVAFLGARPKYSIVASGLDNTEMAEAVRYLDEIGEEYRTDPAKGAVLVHQDRKAVVQKRLMVGQVISAEKIFSYADFVRESGGIHVSNRHRDDLFRIALQNEIKRMIEGLSGVEHARVEIQKEADPEWGVARSKVGTAVTVATKRSVSLDQAMANTIIDLVSSAVRNADPRKITVVDARNWGRKFRKEDPNSVVVRGARRLDLTRAVEEYVRGKVQDFIAQTGFEAAVSVTAVLNLEQIKETVYEINPEQAINVTYEKRKVMETGAIGAGGPTGQAGNAPGATAGTGTGAGGRSVQPGQRSEDEQRFDQDYSRILREILRAPGKSSELRLSVVMHDRIVRRKSAQTGRTELAFVSPSDEQKRDWQALLANIVGLDVEDEADAKKIVVTHMKPNRDEVMAMLDTDMSLGERFNRYAPIARVGGVFLLATFALFFLYGLGKKAATSRPVMGSAESANGPEAAEAGEMEPQQPEEAQFQEMQKRVRAFTEQDPRRAASLVKRWLVREG
jgi:flagellar biosynthesis/type III secretory pathway M-ring protein FliF/YscJ